MFTGTLHQPHPGVSSKQCNCIVTMVGTGRNRGDDQIRINDLLLIVSLLSGAQWAKSTPVEQPVLVTASIFYDVSQAARTDDLTLSLDYSLVTKTIRREIGNKSFKDLRDLSRQVTDSLGATLVDIIPIDGLEVYVKVVQMKPPLHTKAIGIKHRAIFVGRELSWTPKNVTHFVEDLVCPAIIGVNAVERVEKQDVVVKISINTGTEGLKHDPSVAVDLRAVSEGLYEKINASSFQTLEALGSFIASETLSLVALSFQGQHSSSPSVSVSVAKPSALSLADSSEIKLVRTANDFSVGKANKTTLSVCTPHYPSQTDGLHTAAIALGSNLGDSFQNIEYALRLLENPQSFNNNTSDDAEKKEIVNVVDTSFLYETSPMYVEDQPPFVNGACIIETNITPTSLLNLIKLVEERVGRLPSIRNGPRAIDLDIIFYDDQVVDTEDVQGRKLIVPHIRMQEREFVLRPLNDIIPDFVHPVFGKTVRTLFEDLTDTQRQRSPMKKLIAFPQPVSQTTTLPSEWPPETQCHWSYTSGSKPKPTATQTETKLMATLNVTPDSFSDGGVYDNNLPAALSYVSSAVAAGASIIDIGGHSTRPGAEFVSVDDEIERVVPVIWALRSDKEALMALKHDLDTSDGDELLERHVEAMMAIPISIDTFRPEVAEAAIRAGANCINDVCAFAGPDLRSSSSSSSSSPSLAESSSEGINDLNEYTIKMRSIARKYAVPVVLMHSRGDAGSRKDYGAFDYAAEADDEGKGGGAVLEGVRVELGAKVDRIVRRKGGVRRWLVVVDPGMGFSKTLQGNLEILRNARSLVADSNIGRVPQYRNPLRGFPMLIGASKKSFLGEILSQRHPAPRKTEPNRDANGRAFATAPAVVCAVQQEAMIIRVHDVREMVDVVKVTEALLYQG